MGLFNLSRELVGWCFMNLKNCKDSDLVLRSVLKNVKKDVDFNILNSLCDYLYNNGSDFLNSEDIFELFSIIRDIDS